MTMLDQVTDRIIRTLTEKTIGDHATIRVREVLEADIPKGVKTYLHAEVARWFEQDLKWTPKLGRLDKDSPQVNRLMRDFLRSLAVEYVYPRQEFLQSLDHAVHFVENCLCRPQWTLQNFVFEHGEVATASEVVRKLEAVSDYAYYGRLLEQFFRQKGREEIKKDEFGDLLMRIDDQIVKLHTARELAQLTKPMYDFLLLGDSPAKKTIPIKPILIFFADKNLQSLRDHIEQAARNRSKEEISLDDLATLIEIHYTGEVASTVSPETTPGEVAPPVAPAEETTEPQTSESIPSASSVDVPAKERVETEHEPEQIPPQEHREEPEATRVRPEADRHNVALSLTFAGLKDVRTHQSLADLNDLIGSEEKSRFIKKIFKKDDAFYAGVVTALNKMQTWKDASQYLRQLYEINSLDPHSDDVIAFTDAIHQRYHVETSNPT
jgi:hypothetical protein